MYIYIIYIIYTYTVYPLIGIEFPSEGQETGGGPFLHNISKIAPSVECSPLFSPSIKINLAHFFFMFSLFLHGRRRHWKKGTANREILQNFFLWFAFSGVQSRLI